MASLGIHLTGVVPPFESRLRGASLAPKILLIMDHGITRDLPNRGRGTI
jgi:hypothetical protein